MKTLIVITILLTSLSWAHDGHETPGALPLAPHGGVLAEADHIHAGSKHHDHSKANEEEVFFEAVNKKGLIKIYPLELEPKHHKSFKNRKLSLFMKPKIYVTNPRSKTKFEGQLKANGDHWLLDISSLKGRRFILNLSALFKNAKYEVDIQIEKK